MRRELILKLACGLVALLVIYRLGLAVVHINPLYHVTIPALPVLVDSTNSSKTGANDSPGLTHVSTNGPRQVDTGKSTNTTAQSNHTPASSTNNPEKARSSLAAGTNSAAQGAAEVVLGTNVLGTNLVARTTNTVAQATNSPSGQSKAGTNSVGPAQLARGSLPNGMPPGAFPGMPPGGFRGMGPGGMPGMGQPGPPLPPDVQARIDKVIDSEILAPVMRPMPMALLGIAGKDAFLRAPNGQTGLIKEGDELGGVKLIRIGVNRVLVEEQGHRKELTIFEGLGSESLLSAQKDSPK